ncbi:MAG: SpoIIE family protein phosphatase [Ignavibacteriaceae bacterium]|nr:SpoIIE family protein phosphatase [Ignavibacteriaceae bacterium]
MKRLSFLHDISLKISENKPLNSLLQTIMNSSEKVLEAEKSSFLLYNEEDNKLHFYVSDGEAESVIKRFPLEMGSGIAGWVAQKKESELVNDCYSHPRFNPEYDRKSNFVTRSMICVPLLKNEKLIGVISVLNRKDGKDFTNEDVVLLEILAGQCAVAIENSRFLELQISAEALKREMETARDIQQNLLPSNLPKIKDLEMSAFLLPTRQVGGDYYTVRVLNDNLTLFFIADVSGKGFPAALVVSTVDSCLHTILNLTKNDFDIVSTMKILNEVLLEALSGEKFVTAWLGIYDSNTHLLTSINAGHNSPFISKRDDSFYFLKSGGPFLGLIDWNYKSESVLIESGDALVYYSDGVSESFNIKNEMFSEKRLLEFVTANKSLPADEFCIKLSEEIKNFAVGAQQSDDITFGFVKFL